MKKTVVFKVIYRTSGERAALVQESADCLVTLPLLLTGTQQQQNLWYNARDFVFKEGDIARV